MDIWRKEWGGVKVTCQEEVAENSKFIIIQSLGYFLGPSIYLTVLSLLIF